MRIPQIVLHGAAAVTAMCCAAATVSAQVPGLPVIQNAFVNPGLAFAANVGGGSGGRGYYGAAAGWGLRGGKLQVSGAAGVQRSQGVARGAYGGRVAANVWTSRGGALGGAAFVGVGGARRTRDGSVVTNPATTIVPAGVSVGYKRPMGTTRGFAVYAAPFYSWTRSDSGTVASSGSFRMSAGVDFAMSPSLGFTVGGDFGAGKSGSRGGTLGGAITFVPGRR